MSRSVKATCVVLGFLLIFCERAKSLIVPVEIPSVLELVYSQIPPIRKGTDSRLGVGFRLGEHANVQFVVEVGPQTNTDPLKAEEESKRRRDILHSAMKCEIGLWAQAIAKYQNERNIQKELEKLRRMQMKLTKAKQITGKNNEKMNERDDWLSKWSIDMLGPQKSEQEETPKSVNVQRIRMAAETSKNAADKVDSYRLSGSAGNPVEQLNKLFKSATNATK